MNHFFAGVLVPKNIIEETYDTVYNYIKNIMAPYDANIMCDKHIIRTREEILASRLMYIIVYKNLLKNPIKDDKGRKAIEDSIFQLENMTDEEFANEVFYRFNDSVLEFDENGNQLSTYNSNAKWDWWVIGGRWHGELKSPLTESTGDKETFLKEYTISVDDYINVLNEKNIILPDDFVSKDGWVEKKQIPLINGITERENINWRKEVIKYLEKYKDYNIVGVDYHF